MFENQIISWVRTIVPIIAGSIITWFASKGILVEESFGASLILVLNSVFSGLYYICVRLLEAKFPRFGWLLGTPNRPAYDEKL